MARMCDSLSVKLASESDLELEGLLGHKGISEGQTPEKHSAVGHRDDDGKEQMGVR